MKNEQVMQIMADMGQHEGGMDNWVLDNAWVKFANLVERKARDDEREACAKLCEEIEARCVAKDVDDPPLQHIVAAIRERGTT
jgi:hypothetical protein